jgi:uncharacterized LabA/DUF88 family protein
LSSKTGYKQSDDQKLFVQTLVLALKCRPDCLILVASDGDYAPMVEALRGEGIRTELYASYNMLSSALADQAVKVTFLEDILRQLEFPKVRFNG